MNTTDKLATALGQAPAPVKAPARVASKNPIINMLVSDRFKKQMALALPKSLTADRLTRIVLTEFRKTPALLRCDRESLFGAVLQCAGPRTRLRSWSLLPAAVRKDLPAHHRLSRHDRPGASIRPNPEPVRVLRPRG